MVHRLDLNVGNTLQLSARSIDHLFCFTRFHRGLYHHDEHRSILYVNRGVGVAGPAIRFNCPREIATLELG